MKFLVFANNFTELVELANNSRKFAGDENNFSENCRSFEQLQKVCGTRQ